MTDSPEPDWDPRTADVLGDQRAAFDEMRRRCPVAYSEYMQWSLFRHEDVQRVLLDHETYSNAFSRHLSVPNGMDPPEHTHYRRIIEPYFSQERMEAFEPVCRAIVDDLFSGIAAGGEVEWMGDFAVPFAARVQCAFLGWPTSMHDRLIEWTRKNAQATLARDRQVLSALARQFEAYVDDLLEVRLQSGARPEDDATAALMHETVEGRPLSNEEIASILRNWTAGELGTIAASVGILAHFLAVDRDVQRELRSNPSGLPAAIEEILRIDGPLATNRRVTKCPVELGGRQIDAGEPITLNWIAANRDDRVFDDPESYQPDRDQTPNLLWGAGIHVCPGAPLARVEMRVCMEELLGRSTRIELIADRPPTRGVYPSTGFATLPLRIA